MIRIKIRIHTGNQTEVTKITKISLPISTCQDKWEFSNPVESIWEHEVILGSVTKLQVQRQEEPAAAGSKKRISRFRYIFKTLTVALRKLKLLKLYFCGVFLFHHRLACNPGQRGNKAGNCPRIQWIEKDMLVLQDTSTILIKFQFLCWYFSVEKLALMTFFINFWVWFSFSFHNFDSCKNTCKYIIACRVSSLDITSK